MRAALLLAVVALLAASAPAGAAPRTEAAQGFADVLLGARAALKAQSDDLERQYEEHAPHCDALMDAAPKRLVVEIFQVEVSGRYQPRTDLILATSRDIVAGLDAVPTRDPVLRSGRAAWRAGLKFTEAIPPVEDICAELARWRDAGWTKRAEPAVLHAPDADTSSIDRKFAAAMKRLRQLGVSRRIAGFFTGDSLLDGLPEPSFE